MGLNQAYYWMGFCHKYYYKSGTDLYMTPRGRMAGGGTQQVYKRNKNTENFGGIPMYNQNCYPL